MIELLFSRRSIENPSTSLTDPASIELYGGGKAYSGVYVTRRNALQVAAVWRAVNLISRDVAKLPLYVYRRKTAGKVRATDHPAFALLRRKPNDYMTALTFTQTITAHAMLQGNGYAWIERDGGAAPISLQLLDPERVQILRAGKIMLYRYRLESGGHADIRPEDMLHIHGLGYDGVQGYSVVEYGANSLGLSMAADEFGGRFFSNGATPTGILEHPGQIGKNALEALRKSWQDAQAGLSNAHKAAILEEGMKYHAIGISPRDSQLLELRQFEVREIASWFGVPPHKLGDTTHTSFASLEQENQAYLDDALDGWLVIWEAECWEKLLTEDQKRRESHTVEFLREALLRADLSARANYYRTSLAGAPWMSVDEVRARENMPPIGGEKESAIQYPTNNFGDAEKAPAPEPPAGPEKPPKRDAAEALAQARSGLAEESARMLARLRADAKKAGNLTDWLKTVEERHGHVLDAALSRHAAVIEALSGAAGVLEDTKQRLLEEVSR
ncbi:MAG: phage portal protein [Kiritimatiellae bacterium]|nr:phage portal protein [Kiritimatiellia bacterium]